MNKTFKAILITAISVILLAGTFSAGFLVGHLMPFGGQLPSVNDLVPFAPPSVSSEQEAATPADVQDLFKPFWQTWNLIHSQYVVQDELNLRYMTSRLAWERQWPPATSDTALPKGMEVELVLKSGERLTRFFSLQ